MLQLAFAMFILTAFCPTSLSSSDSLNFMVFVFNTCFRYAFYGSVNSKRALPLPHPRAFVNSSRNG